MIISPIGLTETQSNPVLLTRTQPRRQGFPFSHFLREKPWEQGWLTPV